MGIMLDENKSGLTLLLVVSWCALKEGFVPLEDFQTLLNIISMLLWLSLPFHMIVRYPSYNRNPASCW